MEYVKAHSGVEIDYSQEDGEIAEEAIDNASVAPKGRANKAVQNIAPNESATKRSHNTIVHTGHITHPSKSQRVAPAVEPLPSNNAPRVASTFGDMTPQIMQAHKTSAYYIDKNDDKTRVMEGDTPFSPIGRAKTSYDISDTFAEDDEGVIHPTVEHNWNAKGKGKGKGKERQSQRQK